MSNQPLTTESTGERLVAIITSVSSAMNPMMTEVADGLKELIFKDDRDSGVFLLAIVAPFLIWNGITQFTGGWTLMYSVCGMTLSIGFIGWMLLTDVYSTREIILRTTLAISSVLTFIVSVSAL